LHHRADNFKLPLELIECIYIDKVVRSHYNMTSKLSIIHTHTLEQRVQLADVEQIQFVYTKSESKY
jgi:hypothetical protein